MEIVKVRVRPKNGDRRMRTLFFAFDCLVDMKLVKERLSELFPHGYWLDSDKIDRFVVDYRFVNGVPFELCDHSYLDFYKTAPIQDYTNKEDEKIN